MSQITLEQHLGATNQNNLAVWQRSIERLFDIAGGRADIKTYHGDIGNHNINPFYQHLDGLEKRRMLALAEFDWLGKHKDHAHGNEYCEVPYGEKGFNTFNLAHVPQPSSLKIYWGSFFSPEELRKKIARAVYAKWGGYWDTDTLLGVIAKATTKGPNVVDFYITNYLSWFRPLVKDIDYTITGKEIKLKGWYITSETIKVNLFGSVYSHDAPLSHVIPDAYTTGLVVNYGYEIDL